MKAKIVAKSKEITEIYMSPLYRTRHEMIEAIAKAFFIAEITARIEGMNEVIHSSFVQSSLDKIESLKLQLKGLEETEV